MASRILVTGASRGFGRLMTETLLAAGHQVVASMRDPAGRNAEAAAALRAAGGEVVELDVTDDASVAAGVEAAGAIDVLVNNAGVGVLGLQEAFTVEDWQRVFAINVFGVQRVTRAVLPSLRERGSGSVIFVSSILGRMVLPFMGPYNATKWAVEAMAENYRVELSGFGVQSLVVEPGGFATDFMTGLVTPGDDAAGRGYGEMAAAPQAMMEGFQASLEQNPEQDPQLVADAVRDLLAQDPQQRPFRTVVDRMGMGDALTPYNQGLEQVMGGIYEAFEMKDMLRLRS